MYHLPNTGGGGFAYIPIVLCILGAVLYAFTITHDTKSNEKRRKTRMNKLRKALALILSLAAILCFPISASALSVEARPP